MTCLEGQRALLTGDSSDQSTTRVAFNETCSPMKAILCLVIAAAVPDCLAVEA